MAILRHLTQRLLLTGLLFGVVAGSPKAADAEEKASGAGQDLITAQGYGELRVRPDSLRTSVGVEVRTSTLEKARATVSTRLARLIKALTALRIPGAVLQTQTLEFYPIYNEENNNKPRKIIAYSATHRLSVTVLGATPTDLGDYTSRIIDTAIQSGANVIGDVDFFLRDTSAAQGRALEAAVLNAGQNARAMAEAGKVRITRLHSLEESEGGFSPLRFRSAAKVAMAEPTPIETGEIVVTSNVTARFSFSSK